MKGLSMPTSSPGRAEGFPLPLMRFLSSNNGGRSRGRSRSSPVLYLNRLRRNGDITLEPSSPKVTCIGRVRPAANRDAGGPSLTEDRRPRRGWLVRHAMMRFYRQRKAMRRFFSKWFLFLRADYCKKVDANESPFRIRCKEKSEKIEPQTRGSQKYYLSRNLCRESNSEMCILEKSKDSFYLEKESENIGVRETEKGFTALTRCRSAPYRSSSLGGRLWSSQLSEDHEELKEKNSRINRKNSGKFENSMKNSEDNVNGILGFSCHPLLLTRSKSEPARGKEG